ncbi:hypothetical protein TTHERM_00705200 (macronuclear) [Tetrahymena thermophila SB210]|uniref:Uncharacterized protein n=1 Tax=Tetrahymena thermophila (strain SB210) TaxID=312017 RepID=I7M777_TETTS|nr:hypothetical protein TTHERM_00705200 [Tetrahymena thermophila SB210]EAR90704.2 hypothetical protein TTHERM_00705200 [Tetrahymena thermophila SB210]|eukprot:XP_001010949.2 hypothetical protein TTHERM_00705200 [Tetrahymena thermophila SB210]
MSHSIEIEINNLLSEAVYYRNKKDQEDSIEKSIQCIEQADKLIKQNIRDSFINLSYDTIINFAETAITIIGHEKLSEYYIDLFFQRNKSKGQMYIRALLVKARLIALNGHQELLKGEEMITNLQKSLGYVNEALEIIKNSDKNKYSFLIYNASVCVYNIIRFMIKQNWSKYFTDVVKTLDQLFDDVDEPDYNWRCRYTWILFQCLYDSDQKQEAIKVLDRLWENTKKKGPCNFQDQLLRLRIHLCKENPAQLGNIKKEIESNKEDDRGWKLLLTLQMMKSGLILEAQIEKELINVINSMSSSILPGNEMAQTNKLAPIILERLAEAGRIALHHNLINIADSITSFLSRVRQPVQVLQEYNKAELRIKKAGPLIDNKTGMRLNQVQIKMQEVDRRIEALKILEKAMQAIGNNKNSRYLDSDLVYDGAVLIWNISLPFLNATYRQHVVKAFTIACEYLEKIQSNDHALRVNFHLELAKSELAEENTLNAGVHIRKALQLDYSIPLAKVKNLVKEDQDKSLYQRPYERYLKSLQDKINLKSNQNAEAKTVVEKVILDLENAMNQKQENTKIDILQKCLGSLVNLEEKEYVLDEKRDLVEEEINKEKLKHKQDNLYQYKQKKLLAADIAQMAFDWEQDDLAIKACEFVVANTWEISNSEEMILAQVQCYYMMAQITIDELIKDNFVIAFADPERIEAEEENENVQEELSAEKKKEVLEKKENLVAYFLKGLELADSINQSWLVFNGAIYIWNNFLSIFRNPIFDSKLLSSISTLLKKFFETMKVSFKELEKKQIIDYDRDTKIQVNANIGLVYARLMEGKKEYEEVMRVCEALLQLPLGSHTRKLINSIKARVAGAQKGGNKAPEKGGKAVKGGAAEQQTGTSTEHVLFEVVSQLEIITNSTNSQTSQDLIKKCFETLRTWQAKENDETELELHAELWARLARLSLNEESITMLKYSLRCVENSLSLLNPNTDLQGIPSSRLRWYSLAEYLYSENLLRMLNPETQEQKSQEQLLFHALKHAVEGANKGLKAGINSLVLDASKLVWNICAKLQDSALNRKALIKPIFSTIFYLKSCKEKSEPDLILLLSQLLFRAALENEEYHLGENVADMVFELIPKSMQKPVWEAKMIFMSKQGKNELQAISNMKEADASLQSKVWIRLARASNAIYKQYNAYSKAIEILKKENSQEIVEVYIEFAEWLLRNPENNNNSNNAMAIKDNDNNERFPSSLSNVVQQLELAADILIGIENDGDDQEDDMMDYEEKGSVIFSRLDKKSTLSKNSKAKSKASASKKSSKNTTKTNKKIEQKDKRGSASSRMSKASIRVAKTIKSKQSKSIFTQREEDSNPECLNCAHFERLMRIHAMLATVSPKQETQIQYCLDAKLFLIKIFEISFNTLNQFEVNAVNYANIKQQNPNEKQPGGAANQLKQEQQEAALPKYQFPQNVEDWIKLEFSAKFIEKAKTSEDYTFMGKFLFEKAEVTFTYVNYLINVFESAGLHIHNVPLLVFQRFFAREIIGNQHLAMLYDMKFVKLLHLLGYHSEAEKIPAVNQQKLKLTDHERKNYLAKTESSKVLSTTKKAVDLSEQIIPKPNLVKEISSYQIWIDLAKELFQIGDLIRAKDLLNEAYKHAKVLSEKESMGEIHLYLGAIQYLEGEYIESLENHMKSHKFIKEIAVWELSAVETFKTLKKLNKYEDIKNFLQRMIDVFSQAKDKQNQASNILQIEQILCTLYLLLAKVYLKLMRREYSDEMEKEAFKALKGAREQFAKGGVKLIQVKILLNIFEKLYSWCEKLNLSDMNEVNISFRLLSKLQQQLFEMDFHMINVLKYSSLIEKRSENAQTPLTFYHCKNRVQLASSFCQYGLIKGIKKKYDDIHLALVTQEDEDKKRKRDEDNQREEEEDNRLIQNLINEKNQISNPSRVDRSQGAGDDKNLKLKEYISKLNKIIELELQPTSRRFESFEKTISILESIKSKFPTDSYDYVIANIEWARAKRLLAEDRAQMQEIWQIKENKTEADDQQSILNQQQQNNSQGNIPNDLQQNTNTVQSQQQDEYDEQSPSSESQIIDYLSDSLNTINNLYINEYKSIDDPIKSKNAPSYVKKFCQEFLENLGIHGADKSFEFLAKYQHYQYTEFVVNLAKQAMYGKHKFVSYQRLIKHVYNQAGHLNQEAFKSLTQGFKIWDNIFKTEDYTEIITKLLPNGSSYLILQFSNDKRFLYFGFLRISKDRKLEVKLKRKEMKLEDHQTIQKLKLRYNLIKTALVKTPIIQEKDYTSIVNQQEEEYLQILQEIEEFCSFFTDEIGPLINSSPELDAQLEQELQQQLLQQQQEKGAKGAKPAQAAPPKKDNKAAPKKGANKDELFEYESPLPPTKTGIESLVLLLDTSLFNLPFEQLSIFKSIPAISRDFSLLQLSKRLKSIGFQPTLNNSYGIAKDKLKYVAYSFKKDEPDNKYEIDPIFEKNKTLLPNCKWEGVSSCNRIASIGEWQKYLSNGSLLLFYGNPGLMNILTPRLLIDMNEICQTKAVVIIDKINAKKTVLEKYSSLDPEGEKTPLHESLINSSALLTILGISSIASTQWAVEPNLIPQMVDSFLNQLNDEIYISATLSKFKEPQVIYVDRNGVPVDIKKEEDNKKGQPAGKGAANTKKEEKPLDEANQLTEKHVPKKRLATDNVIFVGVPIIRLS